MLKQILTIGSKSRQLSLILILGVVINLLITMGMAR